MSTPSTRDTGAMMDDATTVMAGVVTVAGAQEGMAVGSEAVSDERCVESSGDVDVTSWHAAPHDTAHSRAGDLSSSPNSLLVAARRAGQSDALRSSSFCSWLQCSVEPHGHDECRTDTGDSCRVLLQRYPAAVVAHAHEAA
jgi:hypothetical protein